MNIKIENIKNDCINDKCSRCGQCCSAIPLPISREEAGRIAFYINKNIIKQKNRDWVEKVNGNTYTQHTVIDLRCCFYDSEKQACSIYSVRPYCCQIFQCNQAKKRMEENRKKFHNIAYYNDSRGKNLTNFDLLFYSDGIPMQFFFLKEGILEAQFYRLFKEKGFKYSYLNNTVLSAL